MHSRDQKSGVHVHDNGSVELYSGSSSILLDGTTNTITLTSKKLNQIADRINLRMSPGGLTVPYGKINPQILPTMAESLTANVPLANKMAEATRSMLSPKSLLSMTQYGVKPVLDPTGNAPAIPLATVFNLIAPIKAVSSLSDINRVYNDLKGDILNL